ncbi:hypothetical protein A0U40_05005 [[Bacillus] sp. KCTC 13219]|nr:hypothetical protein A0U40_05005 [[Bacillus] sp. KCTC 13219]
MESLIILIVLGIISSLLGKKDKSKNTKSMPPFNEQSKPNREPRQAKTTPARSLEDFASEIFGQLEQKKAEVEQQWKEIKPVVPVRTERKIEPIVETVEVPKVTYEKTVARPNIEQSLRVTQMKERETAVFTAPTTKKALVQAIVAAEILGPPRAKRRQVR